MTRFHINKHGVPAPCKAKPGNCPLGGDENHFKTQEEAQVFADKQNIEKHKLLPNVKTKRKRNLRKQLEHEMRLFIREKVRVEYNGLVLEGGVSAVEFGADPAFIITGKEDKVKHKVFLSHLNSMTSLKKKNPEQAGDTLAKAIAKEPFYLVDEGEDEATVKEHIPKNYGFRNRWNNMYANEDEAEASAIEKTEKIKAKNQMQNEIKEIKKNFYKNPSVGDQLLYEHKEDFINIEDNIKKGLKDYPNFKGIDFTDVNAGGIQVRGFHKEIDNYSYGDQITIDYDFSNKDEIANNFIDMWKKQDVNDSVESFKNFVNQGEKYGWD